MEVFHGNFRPKKISKGDIKKIKKSYEKIPHIQKLLEEDKEKSEKEAQNLLESIN